MFERSYVDNFEAFLSDKQAGRESLAKMSNLELFNSNRLAYGLPADVQLVLNIVCNVNDIRFKFLYVLPMLNLVKQGAPFLLSLGLVDDAR